MIQNGVIWMMIIVIALALSFVLKKYRVKIAVFGSLFLIAIQMSGYISLFFTADKGSISIRGRGTVSVGGKNSLLYHPMRTS